MEKIMNSNLRKKRRIKGWGFLVAIIILMGVLLNCLHSYQTKQRSIFTSDKWINGDYKDRHYMIDDLEKNYVVIGKTKEELVKLLGEPSEFGPYSAYGDTIDNFFGYCIEKDSWNGIIIYLIGFKNNIAVTVEKEPLGEL